MSSVVTVKAFECGEGVFIPIPEEICDLLGASIGTVFSVESKPDEHAIVLKVKDDAENEQ